MMNFWDQIDKRIDDKIRSSSYNHSMAVVTALGAGTVDVYLPSNPSVTFKAYNPNEIPCEVGDQISIGYYDLSSAVVEWRKTISFDTIITDYVAGVDAYSDANGKPYGNDSIPSPKPFKTIQYAINRLPKNLNNHTIIIHTYRTNTENIVLKNFFNGSILITYWSFYTSTHILNNIQLYNCNCYVTIDGFTVNQNIYVNNSRYINIKNCILSTSSNTDGIVISDASNVKIESCTISNRWELGDAIVGAIVSRNGSTVASVNNGGSGNKYSLIARGNSEIGRNGSQPSSDNGNRVEDSSVIR